MKALIFLLVMVPASGWAMTFDEVMVAARQHAAVVAAEPAQSVVAAATVERVVGHPARERVRLRAADQHQPLQLEGASVGTRVPGHAALVGRGGGGPVRQVDRRVLDQPAARPRLHPRLAVELVQIVAGLDVDLRVAQPRGRCARAQHEQTADGGEDANHDSFPRLRGSSAGYARKAIEAIARGLNVTGDRPGGQLRHFWVPEYAASTPQRSNGVGQPASEVTVSRTTKAPASVARRANSGTG